MKKIKWLAFLMAFVLTACNQGGSGEVTKTTEVNDGTTAEFISEETEGLTEEEPSTETEVSNEVVARLSWQEMFCNLFCAASGKMDSVIPVGMYLEGISESNRGYKYGDGPIYAGNQSKYIEVKVETSEDGSLYGRGIWSAGGTDLDLYPMDDNQDPPFWVEEQNASDNLFAATGTVATEISDSLKRDLEEAGAGEPVIRNLLVVCMHYISEEYFRLNGDIEGELMAQLHLTEIEFSRFPDDPGSGSASGNAKGWLKMGNEEAASIEVCFNLRDSGNWGDMYEMVSGEVIKRDWPESLLSVACELKTETKDK